jgi:uncharacterized protein (DUF433 family)
MGPSMDRQNPYIARSPQIYGGRPVVRGSRILVQTIVEYYKLGMTVDEVLAEFPAIKNARSFRTSSNSATKG